MTDEVIVEEDDEVPAVIATVATPTPTTPASEPQLPILLVFQGKLHD